MSRVTATYEKLRDLIVSRQLLPGAPIIDTHLARRLGVSRTTVRTALHRLEKEGFITATDLGTYSRLIVSPLNKEGAHELARVIAALEAIAAEHAAELEPSARRRLGEAMTRINRALIQAGRREDSRGVFERDRAFHRSYVDAAAGPRVLAIYDVVKPQWDRYGMMYAAAIVDRRAVAISVREHRRIIEAIRAGRVAAARAAVRATWRGGADRLARFIDAQG